MSARKVDEKLRLRGELKKQKVMIYLPTDLYENLKKQCNSKGFSMTAVVEELVREYVTDSAEQPKKK